MKIYGKLNESMQTIIADNVTYTPSADEILMQSERPADNYVANANGQWVLPSVPLNDIKANKIAELKSARDTEELSPIEYGNYLWDFDEKAQMRINGAITVLGENTITWTSADNEEIKKVTVDDLKGVVGASAIRSNELHIKYRNLKAQVENATTKEEVEKIVW